MTIQEIVAILITIKEYYTSERDFSQYGEDYEPLTDEENKAIENAIEILEKLKGEKMNDDLISRQAAIEALEITDWYHQDKNLKMVHGANDEEHQAWYKAEDVYEAIDSVPSVCPERKKGGWVIKKDFMYCPNCFEGFDKIYLNDYKFCPNCGVKMEEV